MLLFKLSITVNISFVRLIHNSIFSGSLCSTFPTSINKDLTTVPQTLFSLCTYRGKKNRGKVTNFRRQ